MIERPCIVCGGAIPWPLGEKPSRYAARRCCSESCRSMRARRARAAQRETTRRDRRDARHGVYLRRRSEQTLSQRLGVKEFSLLLGTALAMEMSISDAVALSLSLVHDPNRTRAMADREVVMA